MQESQGEWDLGEMGRRDVLQEEAGGSQTTLSLWATWEDAALYPKSSGKILKGFKSHEQRCIWWLRMTQHRSLSEILSANSPFSRP